MNLLDANDIQGAYPQSWYAATTDALPAYPPLEDNIQADVCVIGAGFTGLSAALYLAQAGRNVVLIDAQRVGFGASGRNGGQLGSGQRVEQPYLEKMLGEDDALKLWELGQDSKALVKGLIKEHKIDCYLRPGVAWSASTKGSVDELHQYAEHMDHKYGYAIQQLDAAAMHQLCPSPDYLGGIIDRDAGHLHPLRLAVGLAKAAIAAGVSIYEGTRAQTIAYGPPCKVTTPNGQITSDHIILAANGYLGGLAPKVAARVMPINNFIAATEPLGDETKRVLKEDVAVAD